MNIEQLIAQANELEQQLEGTEGDVRYDLHQKLHRCLDMIRMKGGKVPAHLRELDLELIDEEVEDSFDNMPV